MRGTFELSAFVSVKRYDVHPAVQPFKHCGYVGGVFLAVVLVFQQHIFERKSALMACFSCASSANVAKLLARFEIFHHFRNFIGFFYGHYLHSFFMIGRMQAYCYVAATFTHYFFERRQNSAG